MKRSVLKGVTVGLAILLLAAPRLLGQKLLDEHLLLFQPLMGTTWVGHYVGSSDAELEHVVRWEPILDGKVVKSTKAVVSLNFSMETYYYWDWEEEAVSFLQLTNRGIFSSGRANLQDGKIVLLGTGIRPSGVSEFKQTFAVRADGTLEDYFYRREDGRWQQGHLIEYASEGSTTDQDGR